MTTMMPTGSPGLRSLFSTAPRSVFIKDTGLFLPPGKLIDGSLSRDTGNSGSTDVLRAGVLMGKITSSGKYRPSIIGVTNGAISAGTITSITVAAAVATEVARLIALAGGNVNLKLTGPPSANGTVATTAITATAASGTTITISSVSVPAYVTASFITPADGSETPLTMVYEQYGIKTTDELGVSEDKPFGKFPVGGVVDCTQIVNWPSDTSLRAWIWARLNSVDCGKFIPNHLY